MNPLVGGVLALANNVGPKIADWFVNKKQREKEREHDFKLAEYQYQKDVDMWDRMNEYNSPKMQMARFNEAGLNPNLIYGQGSSGNASQMPKYQRPRTDYPSGTFSAIDVMRQYQDFAMKTAQTQNITEQNKVISEQAKRMSMENEMLSYDLKLSPDKFKYQKDFYNLDLEQKKNAILKLAKETNMTDRQVQKLDVWLEEFQKSGVNIDKDGIMDRKIWEQIESGEFDQATGMMLILSALAGIPIGRHLGLRGKKPMKKAPMKSGKRMIPKRKPTKR